MTSAREKAPWIFWPFAALRDVLAFVLGLVGRVVAAVLGLVLLIVVILLTMTVVGAPLGIPLAILGVLPETAAKTRTLCRNASVATRR